MRYYTNVSRRGNFLYIRGRDGTGNRVQKTVKYKPTLYITTPTPETKYYNLSGQPVKPKDFKSMWDAKEFIDQYKDFKQYTVFGFSRFEYSWITENFPDLKYDIRRINVGNIDIETLMDGKGFPEKEEQKAETVVTVISIQKNSKTYVLSWKDYISNDPDVVFFKCDDEKDMLLKFIQIWSKLDLDIITGWNIDGFDLPLLILRIAFLFGWDVANQLSPWGKIERDERTSFGQTYVDWTIVGISTLDFMVVYKKFAPSKRDGYSLNFISYFELGEEKIDYSQYRDLDDLWEKDPQLYIDYNIHDTRLVAKLEKKLKYLERSIVVAYDAKVNFEDALTSVLLWECIFMNELWSRNIIMPITKPTKKEKAKFGDTLLPTEELKGAFVKDVQPGLFDWVVSFDLTSLYPHILIGWNISPETLLERISITVDDIIVGEYDKTKLKERNVGLTGNGCIYDNTKRGFIADVIEKQFKLRKQYKDKMLELEREYEATHDERLKDEITKYDNYQYGKKIQLNAAYGAIANAGFVFYNIDNAGAVTYTGAAGIQYVALKLNEFLSKLLGVETDYIVASDTDSVYINLGTYVKQSGLKDTHEIIKSLDKFCETVVAEEITRIFEEFTSDLNAYKNALHMKRESIIEKALWRGKKNYAIWVWDQEGVRYSEAKLKIKGLEAVRSSTPEICRKKLIQALNLMYTDGEAAIQKLIADFEKEYMSLPIYDIARPTGVTDYVKYQSESLEGDAFKFRASKHIKAAIHYNKIIEENGLISKYRRIHNGDKIKYLHLVKFNPFKVQEIGAPDGQFPLELNIEPYVDKEEMFNKTFLVPMTSILKAAGWQPKKFASIEDFFG